MVHWGQPGSRWLTDSERLVFFIYKDESMSEAFPLNVDERTNQCTEFRSISAASFSVVSEFHFRMHRSSWRNSVCEKSAVSKVLTLLGRDLLLEPRHRLTLFLMFPLSETIPSSCS